MAWREAAFDLGSAGCSTTTIDQPSSAGRIQPLEAVKYRDQRTRTTYSPGSGKDTVEKRHHER